MESIWSGWPIAKQAGLPSTGSAGATGGVRKWIAEDTFVNTALSLVWRRSPKLRPLFRAARGKRIYAIWSASDPLPFLAYFTTRYIPGMLASAARFLWGVFRRRLSGGQEGKQQKEGTYARYLGNEKGRS